MPDCLMILARIHRVKPRNPASSFKMAPARPMRKATVNGLASRLFLSLCLGLLFMLALCSAEIHVTSSTDASQKPRKLDHIRRGFDKDPDEKGVFRNEWTGFDSKRRRGLPTDLERELDGLGDAIRDVVQKAVQDEIPKQIDIFANVPTMTLKTDGDADSTSTDSEFHLQVKDNTKMPKTDGKKKGNDQKKKDKDRKGKQGKSSKKKKNKEKKNESSDESSPCPSGMPQVRCFADPCEVAICDEYPSARCLANYCGGCNADFYDEKTGEKVECSMSVDDDGPLDDAHIDDEPLPCPPGVPQVRCFADPCTVESCPGHPNAQCVANYCGGCFAHFYDEMSGKRLHCTGDVIAREDEEENEGGTTAAPTGMFILPITDKPGIPQDEGGRGSCPDGSDPVRCLVNPCDVASCPARPDARCSANFCGGCSAIFLDPSSGQAVSCHTGVVVSAEPTQKESGTSGDTGGGNGNGVSNEDATFRDPPNPDDGAAVFFSSGPVAILAIMTVVTCLLW